MLTLILSFLQNDVYEDKLISEECLAFINTNAWRLFQKVEYYIKLPQKHLIYIWQRDRDFTNSGQLSEVDTYEGAVT